MIVKIQVSQKSCFCLLFSEQRKKIILDGQTPYCPICGLTLRPGEVQGHLEVELEKLDKLSRLVFLQLREFLISKQTPLSVYETGYLQ